MFEGMFNGLIRGIIALIVIAFILGAVAMWALPKLWHMIKPLIHEWTA